MRKIAIALVVLFVATGGAFAQSNIDGTKHDLGATRSGETVDQICVFCHTPHNARQGTDNPWSDPAVTDAPLWNRARSGATGGYVEYTSNTLNVTIPAWTVGDSASDLCMSCHDGTVATGSVLNAPAAGIPSGGVLTSADAGYLGTDLSNDHPVRFAYQDSIDGGDGELNAPAGNAVGTDNLPLFGGNLECASCHDVHNNTQQPFLLVSNAGSALCLNCHNK